MKPAPFAYLRPETVEGAVAALAEHEDASVLAVAAAGNRAGDDWTDLRVVLAGAEYRPLRVALDDSTLDDAAIDAAVAKVLEEIDPPDDVRASAEYRAHLVGVHVARVLRELR